MSLGWADWSVVLLALALGYCVLAGFTFAPWTGVAADGILRSVVFTALPLAALVWRARNGWRALFRGWRWSYFGWGVVFGVANLAFTLVIGMLAVRYLDLTPNALVHGLSDGSATGSLGLLYLGTGIQLLGEELITILPFLFALWVATAKLGTSRKTGIVLGWLVSALLFASIHLPTYGWHLAQAFLLIGPVRLVLTLAYLKTKSIWASTIAHILNDWSMFTVAAVAGSMAAA